MIKKIKILEVYIYEKKAGRLGQAGDGTFVLSTTRIFENRLFHITFSFTAESRSFYRPGNALSGMFGVFNDSLPDGWGRLLIDRLLLKNRIDPAGVSSLDR